MKPILLRPMLLLLGLSAALCGCANKVDRQLAKGDELLKAGDYERAEVAYLAAVDNSKPDPRPVARLGVMYQQQGKTVEAFRYLRYAVEHAPEDIQARLALARLYFENRSFDEAHKQALELLRRDPGNQDALLLLAELSPLLRNFQETAAIIERAPANAKALPGYHVARAQLLMIARQLDAAGQELDLAVKADPNYAPAYFARAVWHAQYRRNADMLANLKLAAEKAPLRSSFRVQYPSYCMRLGDTNTALTSLRDLTTKAPDYVPGWFALSQMEAAAKNFDEAIRAADKAVALSPRNFSAQRWRGELMIQTGDRNALAHFDRMAQELAQEQAQRTVGGASPSTNAAPAGVTNQSVAVATQPAKWSLPAELAIDLARAAAVSGKTNRAIAVLNELLLSNPTNTPALLLRASLQLSGNGADLALAANSLRRLVEDEPSQDDARLLLVDVYERQRAFQPALDQLNYLIQRSRTNTTLMVRAGNIQLLAGNVTGAQQYYERVLALAPTNFDAVLGLVSSDSKAQKHEEAIARARQYADRFPTADAWHLLYAAYVARVNGALSTNGVPEARDLDNAEAALKKTVELSTNSFLVFDLADFYLRTKQQGKARELIGSRAGSSRDPAFLLKIASMQLKLDQPEAAARSFEAVLEKQPDNALALNDLATIYVEQPDKLDRALELARRAQALQPDSTAIGETLGWTLVLKGQAADGLPLLEAAIQDRDLTRYPEINAQISLHYGTALAMLGDESRAQAALELAAPASNSLAAASLAVLSVNPATATSDQVQLLERRLAAFPRDASALIRLARYQEKTGVAEKAAQNYALYTQIVRDGSRKAAALLSLAKLYAGPLKKTREALDSAKAAQRQDPRNRDAARLAASLAWDAGDHQYATSVLEEAAQGSRDPALLHQLAFALCGVGRVSDAEAQMRKVLAAPAPADLTNSAVRFLTLIKAAGGSNAVAALPLAEEALSHDQAHLPSLMVKAAALEQQKKYPEAAKLYDAMLERWPFFAPATRNLALLYFEHLNDPHKAQTLASKARVDFPDDARLPKVLGVLAYRSNDFEKASQFLNLVASLDPEDSDASFYLGMSYFRLGQSGRAKTYLAKSAADPSLDPKLRKEATTTLEQVR